MIAMKSVKWVHEGWELRFVIHEGVYELESYPMRITQLAYTQDSAATDALVTIALGLLRRHMQSGAVPPHGMVLNWTRAHRVCQGGPADMVSACQVIAATTLAEAGGALSRHF